MSGLTGIDVADAGDLKRLHAAAAGLSSSAIWVACDTVGVDGRRGLGGVPKSRVGSVVAALRASGRTDPIEPLDARTAFEQPSTNRGGDGFSAAGFLGQH